MQSLETNVYTLYNEAMKTNVMQWGNSLAIRIPKAFAQEIHVDSGTEVELSVKGTSLVIAKKRYSQKDLLTKITSENLHAEIETGTPLGNEQW